MSVKPVAIHKDKELPVEYLRECFSYEPETGVLTWKSRPEHHFSHSSRADGGFNKRFAGKAAGSVMARGYLWITLCGKPHFAHRIAWAVYYGEYPDGVIDHSNGVKTDNRISNLVLSTPGENSRNQKLRVNNKSGQMGVFQRKDNGRFRCFIQGDGKRIWLGTYDTIEEAISVRKEAEKRFGYHENHGR
ncbi:HNH endonuclease [Atlantibacter subterraneus]|uniref:HNH endonuclease n=1 Tax=Atlantibacter subterraneus TaxID=255519 RepID=UPI0028A01D2D|nr:HNH endonuclease [Atlantibacter subterranea]